MAVVSDYTALISGYSFNGMASAGAPVFISYAFVENDEVPSLDDYQPYTNSGYSAFNTQQRVNFYSAVAEFESVAGIQFIEVDDPALASIRIMNTSGSAWGGWAAYGYATESYSSNGYFVIDNSSTTYAPGTYGYETLLHELGHSMGLKHPFDGDPTLTTSLDNHNNTLMSYTSNGVNDTSLAWLDEDALQYLYGPTSAISSAWSWNWSDTTEIFTLTGAGNGDQLIGIDASSTISGLGGNDYLWGRDYDDTFIGGAGNDVITGGSGMDTVVFTGNYADYTISYISYGSYSVADNRVSADGTDTVNDVEWFQFADGIISQSGILSGPDDYSETTGTTGIVLVNGSAAGNIGVAFDRDWFAVSFQSGVEYQIDLEGSPTGGGTLTDTYLYGIYDSLGALISNTSDDDAGSGTNSRVTFTATSTDTYYISAAAFSNYTGTYTLSVQSLGITFTENADTVTLPSSGGPWYALGGDDIITGSSAGETIYGEGGNDLINGRGGADTIDGGSNSDTTSYADSTAGVTVRLYNGTGVGGDAQGDTLVSIENAIGSSHGDVLIGTYGASNFLSGGEGSDYLFGLSGADVLYGGWGNDVLNGGSSADTLNGGLDSDTATYSDSTAGVTVRLYNGTGVGGDAQGDTLVDIENAIGSSHSDILIGTYGASNFLSGGEGDDYLFGLSGADALYGGWGDDFLDGGADADTLNGSIGSDTTNYADSTSAVTVRLYNGTGSGGYAHGDTYDSIENAVGSDYVDALIGAYGVDNIFEGGAGADYINGLTGSNTTAYSTSSGSVTVRLYNGTGSGNDAHNDTLVNIDNVIGSDYADALIGAYGVDNILEGGAGADYINGLTGSNTASYHGSSAGVTVRLYNGTGVGGDAQGDTLVDIDNVIGSESNDLLLGSYGVGNIIYGGSGGDHMYGLTGADTFVFHDDFGNDAIHDFENGSEFMDMTGSSLTAGDLRFEVSGGDTIVHFDNVDAGITDTITLTGITSGIDAGDFLF